MNITFVQNSPLNTIITNSADERPLYEVKTPLRGSRTTTIRRCAKDTQPNTGEIITLIHWHDWSSDRITCGGTEMKMDAFLRKAGGFLSSSKTVTGYDGKDYTWRHSSNRFKLTDSLSKTMISQSHRKKTGLFSKPRKMNIDMTPEGIQSLDIIVVSFIVVKQKDRERSEWTAAIICASSTNAAAYPMLFLEG